MGVRRKSAVLCLVIDSIGDIELRHGPDATVDRLLAALEELAPAQGATAGEPQVGDRLPVLDRTGQTLSPDLTVESIGLRDGDMLSLHERPSNWALTAEQQLSSGSATLEMLSGPLKGARYTLGEGSSTIGRVAANDLVIVDPGISRQHAVVVVDETTVTIVDNGSTNGIQVEGRPITEPTEITSGKPILVGHSLMAITHHPPLNADRRSSVTVNRSERQVHRFDEQTIVLPVPPEPVGKRRRPELLTSGRGRHQQAVEHFQASVAAIEQRLEDGRRNETASRFYEAPAISELLAEAATRWRLWERRALDPDGLEVRLGIAAMPSRTALRLPDGGDPELRAPVAAMAERFRQIPDLPAVVDFRRFGGVGLGGPSDPVRGLAHSVVLQLAWFHGPDQLGLACAPGADADSWGWMKWLPHLSGDDPDDELEPDARFAGWLSALLDGTPTSYTDPVTARRPPGETLDGLPEPTSRPPAIVVVVDQNHTLSEPLLGRLLRDGPALGLYSLVMLGDESDQKTTAGITVGAKINVGVESATIDTATGDRIGGISIEGVDPDDAVGLARLISPVRYSDDDEHGIGTDTDTDTVAGESSGGGDGDAAANEAAGDELSITRFVLPGAGYRPAADVSPVAPPLPPSETDSEAGERLEVEADGSDEADATDAAVDSDSEPAIEPDPEPGSGPEPEPAIEPDPEPGSDPEPEDGSGPATGVASNGISVPAAPTMPKRQAAAKPVRLIQSLPHGDDPDRLMLGTVRADGQSSAAVFAWNLSRDAHLGLVGGPGTGKTSALCSVAAAVAMLDADPALVPVIYYLDVRGGLDGLAQLPNTVGATRNDIDGFRSLSAELERQLDERSPADGSNPDTTRRSVLVLIDEVEAFVELLDSLQPGQADALLHRLIEDGPARGMHLALTTTDRAQLGERATSSVRRWLVLGAAGSEPSGAVGDPEPGTARVGKNEIRFAPIVEPVVDGGSNGDLDVDDPIEVALADLARRLTDRGVIGPSD